MNLLAHLDIANHGLSCEVNHRDVVTLAVADVELGDCFPGRVASAGRHNDQERDYQWWGFLPQPKPPPEEAN
jgi:plasmid stability protein